MKKKNLDKFLERRYEKRIEELRRSKIYEDFFKDLALVYREYLSLALKTNDTGNQVEIYRQYDNFNFLKVVNELILNSFNCNVSLSPYAKSESFVTIDFFDTIDFRKVLELIDKRTPEYTGIISLHYSVHRLLSQKLGLVDYDEVKNRFFSLIGRFSDELNTSTFQALTEFLIMRREICGDKVDRELFELFRQKEALGLSGDFKEQKIGYNHFRDNILIALKVDEIEWAEFFLNKYSGSLPDNHKHNEINTGKALISFAKSLYNDSLAFIQSLKKTYFIHYNDYFRISIKANYELGRYEECIDLAELFRGYLGRHKDLSSSFVLNSKTFINDVINLCEYSISSDGKYLDNLEFSIKKNQYPNSWILEKIRKFREAG